MGEWLLSDDDALLELVMVVINRLNVGSACGTITSWQPGVARIVAKMWMMQACKSVLIMDGNTSAASTSAFSAVLTSRIASSVIW